MRILAILVLISLTGCFPKPETIYVSNPIFRPDRPKVPELHDKDLECLSPPEYFKQYGKVTEVYRNLVERDRLISNYIKELENIIDSTGKEDGSGK